MTPARALIWDIPGWMFGVAVLTDGLLNLFRGDDPGLGVAFLLLSLVYYFPVNLLLKEKLGVSALYILEAVLAFAIMWVTLAIGAIAEGYYPELVP